MAKPNNVLTIQELVDKLLKVQQDVRCSRFVFFDLGTRIGYSTVNTVHVDRVGDIILNTNLEFAEADNMRKL